METSKKGKGMENYALKEVEHDKIDDKCILGFDNDVFKHALIKAIYHFKNVNHFQPNNTPGSRAYQDIVGSIREALVDMYDGWESKNFCGLSLTSNIDLNCTLVVTSGDKYTGIIEYEPTTKNPKGFVTNNYVNANSVKKGQNLDLFVDRIDDPKPLDEYKTWVFLYHIDKEKSEIRSELSLPISCISVNGKYQISEWDERHILPVVYFDDDIYIGENEFTDDTDPFIVEKK